MQNSAVLLLTESLGSNSLGRTHCIWQLCRALGCTTHVMATEPGEIWGPLAGSEFSQDCTSRSASEITAWVRSAAPSLIIAVKPLPQSFGVALRIHESTKVPLLLDIDDPDLEYRLAVGNRPKAVAKALRRPRFTRELLSLRAHARRTPSIVSNPWLAARYGGVVIPHVREDTGPGEAHTSWAPEVGFVGSNKPHKGVPELRSAIRELSGSGVTLTITDDPPADAAESERWLGTTTFEAGQALVRTLDIAAVPSRRTPMAEGQLPAKLIDAMLAGRAVVASDVDPVPWGLDGAGLIVPASDAQALRDAIWELRDPARRAELGERARAHALATYTISANLDRFADAFDSAAMGRPL